MKAGMVRIEKDSAGAGIIHGPSRVRRIGEGRMSDATCVRDSAVRQYNNASVPDKPHVYLTVRCIGNRGFQCRQTHRQSAMQNADTTVAWLGQKKKR